MTRHELLATLEEGLENGRISRHMAAYIAAEVLGVAADDTGYQDWFVTATASEADVRHNADQTWHASTLPAELL